MLFRSVAKSEARVQRVLKKTACEHNDWQQVIIERFRAACEVDLDRQMVGASQRLAIQLISRRVISNLRIEGKSYRWLNNLTDRWVARPKYDWDVELSVSGLSWVNDGRPRTLIYNHDVDGSCHHIDLRLFGCEPVELSDETQKCATKCFV